MKMDEKDRMLEEVGWEKTPISMPVKWEPRFYDGTGTRAYHLQVWKNRETGECRAVKVIDREW